MTMDTKVYVENIGTLQNSRKHKTLGVVVFKAEELEELENLENLRVHLQDELGAQLSQDFCFVRNGSPVPLMQEKKTPATAVIQRDKGTDLKAILQVRSAQGSHVQSEVDRINALSLTNSRKAVMSFAVRDFASPPSEMEKREQDDRKSIKRSSSVNESRACGSDTTNTNGFMLKLNAAHGAFEDYFFKIDEVSNLYAFGPCEEGDSTELYLSKTRKEAAAYINLQTVYKIRPYEEEQPAKPLHHFCMEVFAENDTVWVLAVSSVVEFARWIRTFHRSSPKLRKFQYNISHADFTWYVSDIDGETLSAHHHRRKKNKNKHEHEDESDDFIDEDGNPHPSRTKHIESFMDVTFTEEDVGVSFEDCPGGCMVRNIDPDSLAVRHGVHSADFLVSIDGTSVVGLSALEVEEILDSCSRPVTITFGRPQPNSPVYQATSKSLMGAQAWRRHLGPYLYARMKNHHKKRNKDKRSESINRQGTLYEDLTRVSHGSSASSIPASVVGAPVMRSISHESMSIKPTVIPSLPPGLDHASPPGIQAANGHFYSSTGKASQTRMNAAPRKLPPTPPRRKKRSIFFAGLSLKRSGQMPSFSLEESDVTNASRAASRQLSRYRGVQSRLFSAIQTSYQLEKQVDQALNDLVYEARQEGVDEEVGRAGGGSVMPRKKPGTPTNNSPVSSSKPINKLRTTREMMRTENAVSSRLLSGRFTPHKVERIQEMLGKSQAGVSEETETASQAAAASKCAKSFGWIRKMVTAKLNPEHERLLCLVDMARSDDVADREDALEAILDIATSSQNVKTLVEEGMIDVLVSALKSEDSIVIRENAAGIMWNLSDDLQAAELMIASGAIPLLLNLLRHESDEIKSSDVAKEEAAGALWTLADLPDGRSLIISHRGVSPILYNLTEASDATDFTQENLVGVVWHLTFDPVGVEEIMRRRKNVNIIAELARLITRGTVVSQENAAGAFMHISMPSRFRDRIKECKEAITALVQLLAFGSVLSRENACGALDNLAQGDDQTQRLIAEEGAIAPLVRLLQTKFEVTLRVRAALCLRTLAQNQDNKQEIMDAGATDLLIKALREEDVLVQIHYIEALWGLAHESDANKLEIAQSGAIPKLVNILRNGSSVARARAAGALGSLAESSQNGDLIARSGALEPLVEMLQQDDSNLQREAASVLSILIRGTDEVQNKVMKSLQGGALISLNEQDRNKLQSIRTRLMEIEVGDEIYQEYLEDQDNSSSSDSEDDDDDNGAADCIEDGDINARSSESLSRSTSSRAGRRTKRSTRTTTRTTRTTQS